MQPKTQTTVTPMRCVPTLKVPMFAAVWKDTRGMGDGVQVTVFGVSLWILTVIHCHSVYVLLPAIAPGCSPSCGLNALCEDGVCVCGSGYQGDGYSCSGKWLFCVMCVYSAITKCDSVSTQFSLFLFIYLFISLVRAIFALSAVYLEHGQAPLSWKYTFTDSQPVYSSI